jgi:hypothetical protein
MANARAGLATVNRSILFDVNPAFVSAERNCVNNVS